MKAFIEYLVQAVVDSPEEVRVEEEPGEVATTYRVHVAPSDLGKAIGKQGRIANAMRVLAKASAMKEHFYHSSNDDNHFASNDDNHFASNDDNHFASNDDNHFASNDDNHGTCRASTH